MSSSGRRAGRVETRVGIVILISLAAIALVVFQKQFSFNPAVLAAGNAGPAQAGNSSPEQNLAWLPPELKASGPPESFTPDNLYNKIDGKAELYNSAGFVRLNCQRFALSAAPDQWLEWFVYDMGSLQHAFSVFTVQKRSGVQPLDLAQYAYKTQNSLYLVCGGCYVEAVASEASDALMNAMVAMAKQFVASNASSSSQGRIDQLDLLPAENLVPGSYALQTSDVFGFDQFKNVYTAQYRLANSDVLSFVTSCPDAASAAALRDAYRAFVMENGGKLIEAGPAFAPDQPMDLLGSVEIVFSEGRYVGGVHAAPSLDSARLAAAQLRRRLSGQTGSNPGSK